MIKISNDGRTERIGEKTMEPENAEEYEIFAKLPEGSDWQKVVDGGELNAECPSYYNDEGMGVECIEMMIQQYGLGIVQCFCICNAFKYQWRCMSKHDSPEDDVKKEIWYLQKFLELKRRERGEA